MNNPYRVTAHNVDFKVPVTSPEWKIGSVALEVEEGHVVHLDPYRLKDTLEDLERVVHDVASHNASRERWERDEPYRLRFAVAEKRAKEAAQRWEAEAKKRAEEEEERQEAAAKKAAEKEHARWLNRRRLIEEEKVKQAQLRAELDGDG